MVTNSLCPEHIDTMYSEGFFTKKKEMTMHKEPRQRHSENLFGDMSIIGRKNMESAKRKMPAISRNANIW